ncbi:hypothetical protein EQG41_18885 [Billgrantia azerbaijanica]|nr:hypothetical protein EQG41_18885 [Halomonas azerbaijanica]
MKELSLLVHVLASAYFMGEALIQHPSAQQLLRDSDNGFKNLIRNLKQRKLLDSVYFLTSIFGLVAGTSFVAFIVVALLPLEIARTVGQYLLVLCGLSAASWASLGWVFHHRRVIREYLGWLGFFGLGSASMPLMDVLTGAGITPLVFSQLAHGFGWLFPGLVDVDGFFYQGGVIVGFYLGFLLLCRRRSYKSINHQNRLSPRPA